MKNSKLFFAVGAAVLSLAGFIAKANFKKFTQFDHARFNGQPSTYTFHATSHLTNVQGSASTARTLWLATRAGVGAATNLYTALTTGANNSKMYIK